VRFGCTVWVCVSPSHAFFESHFQYQKLKNYIKNACDGETHTQSAVPKRKCNRLLRKEGKVKKSIT
jgi:hypothetical protein